MRDKSDTRATTEILAEALAWENAPVWMIDNARAGVYDDYKGEGWNPIGLLIHHACHAGLEVIVARAKDGDFDGTLAESDAWVASPDGQAALRELGMPQFPGEEVTNV